MNKKQKVAILVGVGIIVLMGLFPPWCWNTPRDGQYIHRSGEYDLLFSGSDYSGQRGDEIDVTRLVIQWIVVAIATAGIVWF